LRSEFSPKRQVELRDENRSDYTLRPSNAECFVGYGENIQPHLITQNDVGLKRSAPSVASGEHPQAPKTVKVNL
jgi:hypothetical protein